MKDEVPGGEVGRSEVVLDGLVPQLFSDDD